MTHPIILALLLLASGCSGDMHPCDLAPDPAACWVAEADETVWSDAAMDAAKE